MSFSFHSSLSFGERREFLISMGWSTFFDQQLELEDLETFLPVRVIGEERELYRVQAAPGVTAFAFVPGKLRHVAASRLDYPAVGDWVLCPIDAVLAGGDRWPIARVLERTTTLARKQIGSHQDAQIIASNVDHVFIASSMNMDFNLRRLERYLALVYQSGAEPILVLTKSDLCGDAERDEILGALEDRMPGLDVIVTSALDSSSLTPLIAKARPSTTNVIVGSSGVGKSTLLNHVLGQEAAFTQGIREGDQKGRHTTTSRSLFIAPNGSLVIDTPGMREIQFFAGDLTDEGEHDSPFADIVAFENQCRFGDCQHDTEPGCAVKAALDRGDIDPERWSHYVKLLRENAFLARKGDKALQSAERQRWKQVAKAIRAKK